jgi:asparagine synthase (glutamine-hydrolysing)
MKSLADQCKTFSLFLRDIIIQKTGFVKYYKPVYEDYEKADQNLDLELIRSTLIEATRKRLMSDVPIGVLLSGGFFINLRNCREIIGEQGLHSFSIGLDADAGCCSCKEGS